MSTSTTRGASSLVTTHDHTARASSTSSRSAFGRAGSISPPGAQFVIATHSPILLACPGARIYSFDADPIAEVDYEDLEHVRVTRAFLNDPAVFIDGMKRD